MIAMLAVLTLVIVVLVVGILLVNGGGGEEQAEAEPSTVVALELNEQIVAKLSEDADYTLEEAYGDFEVAMENSAEGKGVVAIYYADFVYAQTGEVDQAVEILERVAAGLKNDEKIDCYVAAVRLYNEVGDEEQARVYQEKIDTLMPEDTRPLEELMGGEDDE